MCGIFGYIGSKNALSICLEGLRHLEYRGYDSSGIAGIDHEKLFLHKEVGNIAHLEATLSLIQLALPSAIAHTRWATHGRPSQANAHPQTDDHHTLAVVHNGVIENYATLKQTLIQKHHMVFSSDTDTEVIAQLAAHYYQGNLLEALQKTLLELEGSFAVAMVHKKHPHEIVAAAYVSPLIIGFDPISLESFIASDPTALAGKQLSLFLLADGELALLSQGKAPQFFDKNGQSITKKASTLHLAPHEITKGTYQHFMLKEIFEQADTVRFAMKNRYDIQNHTAYFKEYPDSFENLSSIKHILIIACGTSFHAAYVAQYFFEHIAGVSTKIEIASEYRYKNPIIEDNMLVLALSQSGETADTLACVQKLKSFKVKILALCNVEGSTLAREADATLFLHAEPEIAVASTKTFIAQLTTLYLLTLLLARQRGMSAQEGRLFLKYLFEIPTQIHELLLHHGTLETLAKKYYLYESAYFLGRNFLYPIALEGALKLKEIAYVNAVGYAAGEMKHGPIALLSSDVPVIVFCANQALQAKMMSNLMESKSRGAPIIVFGWKRFADAFAPFADDIFFIPQTSDACAPFLVTVAVQLFAYYVAKERKAEIDQPKNLAKSVTVE